MSGVLAQIHQSSTDRMFGFLYFDCAESVKDFPNWNCSECRYPYCCGDVGATHPIMRNWDTHQPTCVWKSSMWCTMCQTRLVLPSCIACWCLFIGQSSHVMQGNPKSGSLKCFDGHRPLWQFDSPFNSWLFMYGNNLLHILFIQWLWQNKGVINMFFFNFGGMNLSSVE